TDIASGSIRAPSLLDDVEHHRVSRGPDPPPGITAKRAPPQLNAQSHLLGHPSHLDGLVDFLLRAPVAHHHHLVDPSSTDDGSDFVKVLWVAAPTRWSCYPTMGGFTVV